MNSRIVVDHVNFHYKEALPVLRDVSLTFEPGSTAVIGQNGAGKTTLMKLLNGLLKPVAGRVRVGDWDTHKHPASQLAKRVGLVFQNPDDQIFKSRVLDEVMFGPLNIGMSKENAERFAREALAVVELGDVAEENPYDLSYSQRKRVCVAAILAMNTEVVVFDEPTMSQDVLELRRMGGIMRDLKAMGKTVIAIVHDMEFAAEHFDRIVVMAEGRVIADGPPAHVFSNTAALHTARVDAPALMKLSAGVGLKQPCLLVEEFVTAYKSEKGL